MATNKNKQSMVQQNMKKISNTAKYINTQVADTVGELIEDAKLNGKEARKMTSSVKELQFKNSLGKIMATTKKVNTRVVKTAKEVVGDVVTTTKKNIQNIDLKSTAIKANDFALTTTENIVSSAVKNGTQLQTITDKAVKGGLNIAARQQDMIFNTLETVKGQILQSADRLQSIFSKN